MIRVDCQQGSEEWLRARLGIPTASRFSDIVTPKKGDPSASMAPYCYELLAEQLLGRPLDDQTSAFMERGTALEKAARAWYCFERETTVEEVGFLLRDDGRVGCSPDGLVGDDGGLEIKCPSAAVHIGYLLGEAGAKYRCQVQGCLWITGRKWWDFVSYNPDMPPVLVRFERDEDFIAKLAAGVDVLLGMLATHRVTLESKGVLPVEPYETVRDRLLAQDEDDREALVTQLFDNQQQWAE